MPLIRILLSVVVMAGCSMRDPRNVVVSPLLSAPIPQSQEVMTSPVRGATGVKTANQLFNSYMALTGLDAQSLGPSLNSVTQGFGQIESQLPSSSDLGAYTAGNQMAINKLAALFCDSLVARAVLPAQASLAPPVFGAIVLGGVARSQLGTESQRQALASAVFLRFWGSPLQEKLPPREPAVADLAGVLGEMFTAATPAEQEAARLTQNMAKTACTAVLASLPVTLQ